MPQYEPKRPKQNYGFTTVFAMMFLFGMVALGVVVLSVTSLMHRNSFRTTEKRQADMLAETGAHTLFDTIRVQMQTTGTYPFSIGNTTLAYTDSALHTTNLGTWSARFLDSHVDTVDVHDSTGDHRDYSYTFFVEGTGTSSLGITSRVVVRFNASMSKWLQKDYGGGSSTPPPYDQLTFPIGAVVSNSTIDINTSGGFRTTATDGLSAHVMANDGISWDTPSGKSTCSNPNVLDIQGQYLVPNGTAYDSTISNGGIGNPNGTKNFRNPAAPAAGTFLGGPADAVMRMPGSASFADETQVGSWSNTWRSTGQSGTAYPGNVNAASITPRTGDGFKVINTPAYITGDLSVPAGQTLRLNPTSSDPKKNIVYVHGNVKNLGQLMNLGVTVVIEGKYSDGPGAEYKLDNQASAFGSIDDVAAKASMISINKSPDSIKFTSNSSVRAGLVYSTLGGIQVQGSNMELTGLLIAGGVGANGGISIHPGGGDSFTVHYDPYSATGGPLPVAGSNPGFTWVLGPDRSGFNPTPLYNWRATK